MEGMSRSFQILPILLAAILLPGSLLGGGKKAPPLSVSFHLQAGEGERQVFRQLTAGREILYRKNAELGTKNIVAYRPFPADDGESYGVVFQLDKVGANRLQALSNASRGQLLLAVVNGQVRDAVVIDKPVNDGLLVIWKWITLQEVRQADQLIPRIGEDPKAWKKRLKEEKK